MTVSLVDMMISVPNSFEHVFRPIIGLISAINEIAGLACYFGSSRTHDRTFFRRNSSRPKFIVTKDITTAELIFQQRT